MKFVYLPIVAIFSLLSFSTALPIELQALRARDEFNVRLEADVSPAFVSPLDKRENTLLTQFFTSLNKTGTGVTLAKAAVRTPVIDDQIVKFVANLIEEKNLTYLLEVADSSGLALDLVLLVLTHYEFIDGLTDFVKYYKGNSNLTSSGSGGGGGLIGGLLGGLGGLLGGGGSLGSNNTTSSGSGGGLIGNLISGLTGGLFGGSSSSSNNSTSGTSSGGSGSGLIGSLLGGLFGGSSGSSGSGSSSGNSGASATTSRPASTGTASGSGSGGIGGLLGGLFGGSSAAGGASSAPAADTAAPAAATTSNTAAAATSGGVLDGLLGGLGGNSESAGAAATSSPAGAAAATSAPVGGAAETAPTGTAAGAPAGANTATGTGAGSAATTSGSALGGLLDNLLKRDDEELAKRDVEAITEHLHELAKRAETASYLERRDIWDSVYQQMIRLIGSDANIEDVAVSLKKSGLAINVIYNAIMDSDWYGFDKKLVKYLVDNNIVTWSILFRSLIDSGVVLLVIGDIIGNSDYIKLVIDFVIAIITGRVNVIGLILAFF